MKSENPVPAAGVPACLASVLSLVIDRAAPPADDCEVSEVPAPEPRAPHQPR